MLFRFVRLKECGLGTQSLGLDWPLSEVGTRLEQKRTCYIPHHLIIWACHLGPDTEHKIRKMSLDVTDVESDGGSQN